MPVQLFTAPAAQGKTAFTVQLAYETAKTTQADIIVCVSTQLQVTAWEQRLAAAGGALGIQVLTFAALVNTILDRTNNQFTRLSIPVQQRLIHLLLSDLSLSYYEPLLDKPGFIIALQQLFAELKTALVTTTMLTTAVPPIPRLQELAAIYHAYQTHLQANHWADQPGLNWLAVEALGQQPKLAAWPLLIIDGFDNFTAGQLTLWQQLTNHVEQIVITLTDATPPGPSSSPYPRFQETKTKLENSLGIEAKPLPMAPPPTRSPLKQLAAALFTPRTLPSPATDGDLHLIEAANQVDEVRAALRWLKTQQHRHRYQPAEMALLALDITPYQPHILQIGAEFDLPLQMTTGYPLKQNPAVAALLTLLQLGLPDPGGEPFLAQRPLVETWRSPYFDWSPLHIEPADADKLNHVARDGRVLGFMSHWQTAFHYWRNRTDAPPAAALLHEKFNAFWQRCRPPSGKHPFKRWVLWLENLIGPDPDNPQTPPDPQSLNLMQQVRQADPHFATRDRLALQTFKELLRGLVWAEAAVSDTAQSSYSRFYQELLNAVEAGQFQPMPAAQPAIVVANVGLARGIPFKAVAVLGLAEGLFPAVIQEDPFLRDSDRELLASQHITLDPSTQSTQREYFYEAVTRPSRQLLLTRPRLADNGAEWLPSPFWKEVRRLVNIEPERLNSEQVVSPALAASWPELLAAAAAYPQTAVSQWLQQHQPAYLNHLQRAASILQARTRRTPSPFEGDLSALSAAISPALAPDRPWSASRLEQYRTCAYFFFVRSLLNLEPLQEPATGLDARQLGAIYHHIFEQVYRAENLDPRAGETAVKTVVTEIADPILDKAPRREGFRETAWWQQTRREIIEHVTHSIIRLDGQEETFTILHTEAAFFGEDALTITVDAEAALSFKLHGLIDRVDRNEAGEIRIIDYKLGSPSGFTKNDLISGKKLQLPLYALAAEQALGLGQVTDAFYWHVRHAQKSTFTLAKYEGGPAAAIQNALDFAWTAVTGARAGQFQPSPPADGCPTYCPAAAFCWHYAPR